MTMPFIYTQAEIRYRQERAAESYRSVHGRKHHGSQRRSHRLLTVLGGPHH